MPSIDAPKIRRVRGRNSFRRDARPRRGNLLVCRARRWALDDLVRALQARKQCADSFMSARVWNFSQDAQGWETWNDLSDFENREGMLTTRATGDDPYMASPEFEIDAMAIGEIEIVMRVRADAPVLNGEVYWLSTGQGDFSPDLQAAFLVQADGALRAYRVDIARGGRLFIGDKIVRLRFDPSDAPAEIEIKTITVYAHCTGF